MGMAWTETAPFVTVAFSDGRLPIKQHSKTHNSKQLESSSQFLEHSRVEG